MLRRRSKNSTNKIRTACGQMIERLEERQLLTTISSTGNFVQTIEYKSATSGIVRVAYKNVTAELVFGNVSAAKPTQAILGDRVLPGDQNTPGKDLYHIYIQKASIDSYISIAQVPDLTTTPRPMNPFGGSVQLNIISARTGQVVGVTAGTGGVLLGAKTVQVGTVTGTENHPIISVPFYGLGILPKTKSGKLTAGLSMAPGQDLGRFLFGGAITGAVYVPSGSIDTFYCGALLTGLSDGQVEGDPKIPENFYINGDLRNLLVNGPIGTDNAGVAANLPTYTTEPVIHITGQNDMIKSAGTNLAFTRVDNSPKAPGIHSVQREIEDEVTYTGSATAFENGDLGDGQVFFNNDALTPTTTGAPNAQFLGVFDSKKLGNQVVAVQGAVDNEWDGHDDVNDSYAVGLMAGQTVTLRLIGDGFIHMAVYDPDNRMVASDYDNNGIRFHPEQNGGQLEDIDNALINLPWRFTPTRPGIYRIVLGETGADANQAVGYPKGSLVPYQLRITGLGNVALGGIVSGVDLWNSTNTGGPLVPPPDPSILITDGDLGAIQVAGRAFYFGSPQKQDIEVHNGNLRSIEAGELGTHTTDTPPKFGLGPSILVTAGSIGLLRGDAITTDLEWVRVQQHKANGIGGDIQTISSPNGTLYLEVHVDRSIGTIAAKDMATVTANSIIEVNADKKNNDGVIDLIDIDGDLGTIEAGGPEIITNAGGNVRYMHAGGSVFRDRFFGGNTPEATQFLPGQEANFVDDSGSRIRVRPTIQPLLDTTGQPVLDQNGLPITNPGTLTVTTYPIRSGGVVVMDVTSTTGVLVDTTAAARGGSAEIGRIDVTGAGAPLITDPGPDGIPNTGDEPLGPDGLPNTGDEPLIPDPTSTNDNQVRIRGSARTDVFSIAGTDINSIKNQTDGGEIVDVNATSIGIAAGSQLGTATPRATPAELYPMGLAAPSGGGSSSGVGEAGLGVAAGLASTFPFNQQRVGWIVSGAVPTIYSSGAIGNIMVDGQIQTLVANSGGKFQKGIFEGINGPIFATGDIQQVNIGEGILPSGTGNLSQAGLYSMKRIDSVVNQGAGSDIRGDIFAHDSIGKISLNNGSIINADIGVSNDNKSAEDGTDFLSSEEFVKTGAISELAGNSEIGKIDGIGITGNGGIIGAVMSASNIGPVVVKGGYGIFSSFFTILGDGRYEQVSADGYGIRNSFWQGGAFADGVAATGNGKFLSTAKYESSVRFSEKSKFDPYFGIQPSAQTDLNVYLGTSARKPVRRASSYSGAIDNTRWITSRDLGNMTANSIHNVLLNFGNSIAAVQVSKEIQKLSITSGRLDTFRAGSQVGRANINISGPIGTVHIGGTFQGSSSMLATGPNGTITDMVVDGSLYGDVSAQASFNTLRVGHDDAAANVHSGGNFKQIILGGSLLSGATIDVSKTLQQIIIGGDVEAGAVIEARDILHKSIKGANHGTIKG